MHSTDRTGFGFAAVFIGGVAAAQFGRPGRQEDIAVIMGIAIAVMAVIAISFDGERAVPPWKRAAIEWRRLKSYLIGVLATVPLIVWIGVALSLNNEWGVVVFFAPFVVAVLGLVYLFIIDPRLLRRRLMREEFKDDI
jgi:hypothetical protein